MSKSNRNAGRFTLEERRYMEEVYIKKAILTDSDLDHSAISTYIALRCMYLQDEPIRYVSVNEMCYKLYGNTTATRSTKEKIVAGLERLLEKELVLQVEQISKSEFVLDLSKLHINSEKGSKDYFVIVKLDEIRKIMNYPERVDRLAILRFFTMVIGSISYTTTIKDARGTYGDAHNFVGFMPQEYLAEISYVSESSACAYIAILEELQILYVYRHADLKWDSEKKQISSFVNKYGRFENREMIQYFAENYESFTNIETIKKMQKRKDVNYRRGLMQKYRCFYNGHVYDEATQREMYAYVHFKNQLLLDKIENAESDEQRVYYQSQLLDESVFKETIKKEN